jgi:Glycosyltransferase family 87/WD40-like Beta Propeller Repeat
VNAIPAETNAATLRSGRSQPGSRYSDYMAIAEWTLLAVLLAVFAGRGFLPAWRTLNTDFPNYYLAASLYHRGIPLDRAYEWIWFQRQKDYQNIPQPLVGFVPNPPICALPILPFSGLSPLAAKRTWLVLNLGFFVLALELLRRVTKLPWRRTGLISLLCVVPLRANFLVGQYYILILLLICAAYYSSCLGHRLTSGMFLAAGASLKLFPAFFLILFAWRRDWRSAAGLILGVAVFAAISVALFGAPVHWVFLIEVLPRALHGDMVGPYSLQWNSFNALWHHLFLFEPELNPSPLLNSPALYAFAQATTAAMLLFSFLPATSRNHAERPVALEWATLVSLLLLLSSMPSSYHYCVLIFTAVIGMDELLRIEDKRKALGFILLFTFACAPVPGRIARLLLPRLCGTIALYALLLHSLSSAKGFRIGRKWLATAAVVISVLTISNLSSVKNRTEDFRRRLSNLSTGYSASNPVAIGDRVVFTEMFDEKYAALSWQNGEVREIPLSTDVLSIGGNQHSPVGYFEQVTRQSSIVRLSLASSNPISEQLSEGQRPTLSWDGRWLAFIREEHGRGTIWLIEPESQRTAQLIVTAPNILDISVTSEGDLIAAVGPVSEPHLALVRRSTGIVEPLSGLAGPARYPAISHDGKRLAFSRRQSGSWQLVVRDLGTGAEQQLTHTACNATLPSWEDANTLLYATDCGRGFGLTAIARVAVQN